MNFYAPPVVVFVGAAWFTYNMGSLGMLVTLKRIFKILLKRKLRKSYIHTYTMKKFSELL